MAVTKLTTNFSENTVQFIRRCAEKPSVSTLMQSSGKSSMIPEQPGTYSTNSHVTKEQTAKSMN